MKTTETEILSAGEQGPSGPGMHYGVGAPAAELGRDGAFYIDTAASRLYGPKTAGAWGAGTSLLASVTAVSVLTSLQAMSPEQLTALRALLGFATYSDRDAANAVLAINDPYFDTGAGKMRAASA